MKPQGRTVTVSVFRKGKQVSTTVLSIEEFRRRHPLGDPFTGRAPLRVRPRKMKSADLVLASLFALLANDSPGGNQCYLLANDEGQAGDDLSLAKKLIGANERQVGRLVLVQKKEIVRRDGKGFLQILPAQDVVGA